MRKLAALAFALSSLALFAERDMAIYRGKLTSDLNANGNRITSVDLPLDAGDAANKEYVDAHGGCDTNAVDILANSAVVTNALTVATTNRIAALETATNNLTSSVSALESSKLDVAGGTVTGDLEVKKGITVHRPSNFTGKLNVNGSLSAKGVEITNGKLCVESEGYTANYKGDSWDIGFDLSYVIFDFYDWWGFDLYDGVSTNEWFVQLPRNDGTLALQSDVESKADRSALTAHTENTDNPHAVTAEQVGALSTSFANSDQTFDWNTSGDCVRLFGTYYGTGIGLSLNSIGGMLYNYHDGTEDWYKLPTGKSGTLAIVDDISAAISATNPTFSSAVLAVGLNIDTNSVAVLNEIAATFGGFPIEGTAPTVGGLLAALAAAAAWLKKNKVGSFESVGGATATVENGVAKLDDFFTNSNSLLISTIASNSARLALDEDGEIIVTMNTED